MTCRRHDTANSLGLEWEIVTASVEKYGFPTREIVQLQISIAYRNEAISLLLNGNEPGTDEMWAEMLKIDGRAV
jgi:hypothetical protein